MIRKHDYFRLGAFIIVGTCMLVAMVVILGAGRYFQTTYKVESYFNESVNGLAIGSPVKLRGVSIGRVCDINFVPNKYKAAKENGNRFVLVECDIDPSLFKDLDLQEFNNTLNTEVERGLRVRPTSLGLTGQLFLNFVYTDPDHNPPLAIDWEPDVAYVPSVPSTLGRLEGAVTTISKNLSGISQDDITSIIHDVKSIVDTIEDFMSTEGGKEAGKKILDILNKTHGILARTNELLSAPETERLIPETAALIGNANSIVSRSADDIVAAAAEAKIAMENLNKASEVIGKTFGDPRMDDALAELAPTMENISKASTDLAAAVAKVHNLANRLNSVVASEEENIHSILEDTREVMQNIKELSGDAKRYPSGVFFGKPPSKPTTGNQ